MNIYLDYEPLGVPAIDNSIGTLFTLTKQVLKENLTYLSGKINEEESGIFLIRYTPKICELMVSGFSNELTAKIQKAIKDFDIERIYKDYIGGIKN